MVRDGAAGGGAGARGGSSAGRVPLSTMGLGMAVRREAARRRAEADFGSASGAALDLVELLELAWHDCHGELAPPGEVMDDLWLVAGGDLARLVSAARLAVTDRHDLATAADRLREAGALG